MVQIDIWIPWWSVTGHVTVPTEMLASLVVTEMLNHFQTHHYHL